MTKFSLVGAQSRRWPTSPIPIEFLEGASCSLGMHSSLIRGSRNARPAHRDQVREPPSNPTFSNPKRRAGRQSKCCVYLHRRRLVSPLATRTALERRKCRSCHFGLAEKREPE